MKIKKLLSSFLAMLLVFSMMPSVISTVKAAEETTQEVRYSTDGGATWKEDSLMNALWGSYTSSDVKIELLRDITLDKSWYAQQDLGNNGNTVVLDGKGFTIKRGEGAKMLFCVRYGSNVTLQNITIDGGAVWSSDDPATRINTGISLQGNNAHLIYVDGGATLTLESGVILQNSDLGSSSYGGALVVGYSDNGNGKLIMKDGVIIRNNRAESGGAICVMHSDDNFEMQGGKIYGNYATSGGGAVYTAGTFTMLNGEIYNNASGNNGGAVSVNGEFTMTNGKIYNNKSEAGGGGITALGGNVVLNGGSIKDNSITGSMGGGVLVHNGTLTISNNPIIADNTSKDMINNVYLNSGKTISISTELTNGATIGVTTKTAPTEESLVNVTGANTEDYSSYFTSDNTDYEIINTSNTVQLQVREKGTVAELSELSVEGVPLNSEFSTDILTYTATVENNISEVTIKAAATDSYATISGTGKQTLTTGENTFIVTVTSDDGNNTKSYTITITRKEAEVTPIYPVYVPTVKDEMKVDAEHVHDEEEIDAEVTTTDSEVKEIVGRKNILATIELEETDHKVEVTIETGKKNADTIVYVVKIDEETGELIMMSAGKTDEDGLLVFETEPSETLTLTTDVPEDFCSQGEVSEGVKYYVTDEGELYKGWHEHDSHWHFFDYKTAVMKMNHWQADGKNWYFFKNGVMLESTWIAKDSVGEIWYYVDADGRFVRNTWIDGYYIDANGEWRA